MEKPIIPLDTPFSLIDCLKAFSELQEKQALYAHYFAQASWNGAKMCFFQRSYESPAFLYVVLRAFQAQNSKQITELLSATFDENDIKSILIYTASFLENGGNYKSFGDSKFVPDCSQEVFVKFWMSTPYWSQHKEEFDGIWSRIGKYIFEHEKPYGLINFRNKEGTTGYYSSNCSSEDADKIKKITVAEGLMCENNRLVKISDTEYIIKIAAVESKEETIQRDGIKIHLKFGEFAPFLAKVVHYLGEAKKYAANEIQEKMIDEYICHFKTGDMKRHKESQKLWIQDKQPIIETNIGFIESYLDPLQIRAEFQGFVSIVNKTQSALLTKLVENAPTLLEHLPWGKNFEVDEFKKPDFTSLEILAFASSGVPVGINIPNYDDIRENFGFKNVNLGNVYGEPTAKNIEYCPVQEIDRNLKCYKKSLFVIVALHELLGHGSGKILHEKPTFPNPIDGSEINTFYGPNETWHSVFKGIASTYEECRADSIALYLSTFEDVQEILLPTLTQEERWEVVYAAWFSHISAGLKGMIYYDKESKKWLQAHIGGRYAILKVVLEAGGIIQIKQTERDGKEYLEILLNRENIKTKGRQAIGRFIKHLQIYKSSADVKRGTDFINGYLEVDEVFMKYRDIVEKNKKPRRMAVQPHTYIEEGSTRPVYKSFQASSNGCIDAFVAHYREDFQVIIKEWEVNNQEFRY